MIQHELQLSGPNAQSPAAAMESAYRRGFMQGIAYAIHALDRGADAADLDQWMLGPLASWRYQRHGGKFDPPADWVASGRAAG